jgi:SnoaL-like domain
MDSTQYSAQDVQECMDREAIRDLMYRYAHGIDRCNAELLNTVFWPGCIDEHGDYNGSSDGFIAWVMPLLKQGVGCTLHLMGNSLIRIDGKYAAVETYFQAFHRFDNPPPGNAEDFVIGGRYVDRMEKRGKQWRVAHRTVAYDYLREFTDSGNWMTSKYSNAQRICGARTPNDPTDAVFGKLLWNPPFQFGGNV